MGIIKSQRDPAQVFAGVLLGTAVGDALGLPAENLSPERIQRLWKGQWRMRFFFGRGMISDDTEHTLMIAQSLLTEPEDAAKFQSVFAWKLRWWFAALSAGVGLSTARASIKLWLGFPPNKAAVNSAGAGPAMRSAIIGAYFADDPAKRREFVLASSRLTHRSWQAETAALAVAESAEKLANQKQSAHPLGPVNYFWPAIIPRNLFFLAIVLAHGLRRLLHQLTPSAFIFLSFSFVFFVAIPRPVHSPSVPSILLSCKVLFFCEDFHAAIFVSSSMLACCAVNNAVMALRPLAVT
jgi:hypothetical protein